MKYRSKAKSISSLAAYSLVDDLQLYFVTKLDGIDGRLAESSFQVVEWLRDEGKHGGGRRFEAINHTLFNRASVNVSQVHYDDFAEKKLRSATALSTIIHPQNPFAPSIHMHISWTEMKSGAGYWRIMADLNPAIENSLHKTAFEQMLKQAAQELYEKGVEQGERYFYIPALERWRGISHFYLEQFSSGDQQADSNLAYELGRSAIDCYINIIDSEMHEHPFPNEVDFKRQLAYHTLYFFQVLTLDRGTTSGLLIHDQNDVGIMGSLPSRVDLNLLRSWKSKLTPPQDELLQAIIDVFPAEDYEINEGLKLKLSQCLRKHYALYPHAVSMQARGELIPPTVINHQSVS